jgi:hypothetical protein
VVVTASTTVPTDSTTSVGTTSAALPIGRGNPLAGVSQDGMDTSQIPKGKPGKWTHLALM